MEAKPTSEAEVSRQVGQFPAGIVTTSTTILRHERSTSEAGRTV